MNTPSTNRYKNHRFPAEIIRHAVWLYFRFGLSYRDIKELLFARGVTVTYEAIRKWCRKFGQAFANQLRRRRPRPGDKWHLEARWRKLNAPHLLPLVQAKVKFADGIQQCTNRREGGKEAA
jgi:putative transposase